MVSRGLQGQGTVYFVSGRGLLGFAHVYDYDVFVSGDCGLTRLTLLRHTHREELGLWGLGGVLFGWLLWFFGVKKYGLTRKTGDNTVIDER